MINEGISLFFLHSHCCEKYLIICNLQKTSKNGSGLKELKQGENVQIVIRIKQKTTRLFLQQFISLHKYLPEAVLFDVKVVASQESCLSLQTVWYIYR